MTFMLRLESDFVQLIGKTRQPANPYHVHREFDPTPAGLPFEQPSDEEVAAIRRQLERNRRELNSREMSQKHVDAAIDAMVRGASR